MTTKSPRELEIERLRAKATAGTRLITTYEKMTDAEYDAHMVARRAAVARMVTEALTGETLTPFVRSAGKAKR